MDNSNYSNRRRDDYVLFSDDDDCEVKSSPISPYRRQLHKSPGLDNSYDLKQRYSKSESSYRLQGSVSPSNQHRHDNAGQRSPAHNLGGVYLGEEMDVSADEGSGGVVEGGARNAEGRGFRWFILVLAKMDLWKLLLVGGVVGVVFGSVYQGGFGSHFLASISSQGVWVVVGGCEVG